MGPGVPSCTVAEIQCCAITSLVSDIIVQTRERDEHFFSVVGWTWRRGMCGDVSSGDHDESLFFVYLDAVSRRRQSAAVCTEERFR